MAEVRIHLKAHETEELGENIKMLAAVHRMFEDGENADPFEFYGDLTVIVNHCNAILEWVTRVRTEVAHQGVAA